MTRSKRKPAPGKWRWGRLPGILLLLLAASVSLYAVYLDHQIRTRFEGQRWALPARVYAHPLELYEGAALGQRQLIAALDRLGYREQRDLSPPATYSVLADGLRLHTRGYAFPEGTEPSRTFELRFQGATVRTMDSTHPLVRLEPELIGGFLPTTLEDRLLVRLADVPPLLPQALLLLEDRDFYRHHGVSVRAIARALWADLRARRMVQGGSTITQQLVKNFFLTADRTLWRKFTEALMALMLEAHYSKDEILEAYLNEVFLGQVGKRSINGIAQGAVLYFGRPLEELDPGELALLAGLVRAPSHYDPRRQPQRALARRNQVLALLAEHQVLPAATAAALTRQPLRTGPVPQALARYPAFLDLVRRQLARDYPEATLRRDGIVIYSTLDPLTQRAAEDAVRGTLQRLSTRHGDPRLEAALVVAETATGGVLAVVGGRDSALEGFNRALDASRQVGSLAKPAVYLTALSQPQRYNLASVLDDEPLTVKLAGAKTWKPGNADGLFLGPTTLLNALVQSRNVPTAALGLAVGVPEVIRTLGALGVQREIPPVPATLLGAFELTPFEVTQVYLTLANSGFRTPLRAIQAVTDRDGLPLTRYPLRTEAAVNPAPTYLISAALTEIPRRGTARDLARQFPDLTLAGKTGTSNDQRDSWFAGFTGDLVAAAWIGHDDNSRTALYGATGAMQVWAALMHALPVSSVALTQPPGITWISTAPGDGLMHAQCPDGFGVPVWGLVPADARSCDDVHSLGDGGAGESARKAWRWLQDLF